jgi:hypothetical protein
LSEEEKHIDSEKHFSALQMTDPILLYTQSKDLIPAEYPAILASLEKPEHKEEGNEPVQPAINQPVESEELAHSDEQNQEVLSHDSEVIEEAISRLKKKRKKKKKKKKGKKVRSELKIAAEAEEPASAFIQWMKGLEKPELIKSGIQKSSKAKRKNNKIEGVQQDEAVEREESIEVSTEIAPPKKERKQKTSGIQLSSDMISETLAEVLASQGHTHAAIEMYEKLCLIYPEKKTLFAIKIEKLKKD